MGRELRRVPFDFDYPLNTVWYGYFMDYIPNTCMSTNEDKKYCKSCKEYAKIKGIEISDYGCPDYEKHFSEIAEKLKALCEPPEGEGFQLWETTSEGSPVSPVFKTLDELCEWCEDNATVFADFKASKEKWKEMLEKDFVHHKQGNFIFI